MPQGTTRPRASAPQSQTTSQPKSRATSARRPAPRVGSSDKSAAQPEATASRDMNASEPRRNPAGRSGRPSGPDGLKHEGTREAQRVSRAGTAHEERPTTRTRSGAAGRKTSASTPASSASGATARRTPPRKGTVEEPAHASAAAGMKATRGRSRGATAATAAATGLRPEGARGGGNRTRSRSDAAKGNSTGRSPRK